MGSESIILPICNINSDFPWMPVEQSLRALGGGVGVHFPVLLFSYMNQDNGKGSGFRRMFQFSVLPVRTRAAIKEELPGAYPSHEWLPYLCCKSEAFAFFFYAEKYNTMERHWEYLTLPAPTVLLPSTKKHGLGTPKQNTASTVFAKKEMTFRRLYLLVD